MTPPAEAGSRIASGTGAAGRTDRGLAAGAGVAAVVLGAGVGEALAALLAPRASPFAAIGSALIDLAPAWAKDAAIALFGTADKIALLVLIGAVLLGVAAVAGLLERRRAPWGAVLAAALGVLGAIAAVTRADAGVFTPVPSIIAGAVAAVTLTLLLRRRAAAGPGTDAGMSRRSLLIAGGAATVVGIAAAVWATTRATGERSVAAIRAALRLPAPRSTQPVPGGADLGIPDLAPVITPNDEFYRIDTALIVPEIDPAAWRLRIHGLVENEIEITWDELLSLPLSEHIVTLACVSNEVGGALIGNARWLGYPIRELLARARPLPEADMVLSRSQDGFTAGTPLEALTDDRDALLAVGMNGEPLPIQHGFPVRMVVPGLYGYVSATKWVVDLEVTRFDRARAYWSDRGWSERGPIKLQSRIDVPRAHDIPAGEVTVAGVAWHQHVGVAGVEVQVDDGPWMPARLATAISADTWVQWSLRAVLAPGEHVLRCRALSADGTTQTSDTAPPAPDGATGWHTRRFVAA
ncbi:molybdopterin-dependent oxidoreductase [Microbacterium paludicola]|uniref:Oxidoreductase n=1 Tax=Microbacterium paludicola TaxID=300019 RepID=A0A4Y9FU42_9MICO|nr:molybdopterin-dependent oxidoreductase [Microbacterium paludicola]MBF0816509.1 molybdopterin-dependent oxidoreductase [Microbacterium paludicola]TFU32815.1 oxidoreductase [Microbacterium paludicola]